MATLKDTRRVARAVGRLTDTPQGATDLGYLMKDLGAIEAEMNEIGYGKDDEEVTA